jgi:hypothetical protein
MLLVLIAHKVNMAAGILYRMKAQSCHDAAPSLMAISGSTGRLDECGFITVVEVIIIIITFMPMMS